MQVHSLLLSLFSLSYGYVISLPIHPTITLFLSSPHTSSNFLLQKNIIVSHDCEREFVKAKRKACSERRAPLSGKSRWMRAAVDHPCSPLPAFFTTDSGSRRAFNLCLLRQSSANKQSSLKAGQTKLSVITAKHLGNLSSTAEAELIVQTSYCTCCLHCILIHNMSVSWHQTHYICIATCRILFVKQSEHNKTVHI